MIRKLIVAGAFHAALSAPALADAIEGNWKTKSGETAAIASCGSAFCVKLKTGKHAGKQHRQDEPADGGSYSGTITDPANDKTYSGSASISGRTPENEADAC
jgi:uncharacterized protein (DUF2147 family)